jgi:2-polyprenyl-6-methoxyphenol hydroxylase-like FAD-dependent oxidoreductase
MTTQVVIVGGGPVGLTLAMDLAWRGIDVIVAEVRQAGEPPSPKCNHISARSMEIFRRLGFARAIRDKGLPVDHPHDIVFCTTLTGTEITRIPIPPSSQRYTRKEGPDCWWPTPEPPHRANQIYLEPILFEHASGMAKIKILNRTSIDSYEQDNSGVTAVARDLDSGETYSIDARYLVGCDGGKSWVRKSIGARMQGTPVVQMVQSTYISAPDLMSRIQVDPAWMYIAINSRRNGTAISIDGADKWLIHNYLYREQEGEQADRDWAIRAIFGVDSDFSYEILSNEDWVGRRLIADRYRDRRVFICGDAAHLWIPFAGYGMNAGIADAANLSWMLAAVLNGWGGLSMLDAYERERQPITDQVSHYAMNMAVDNIRRRGAAPAEIEATGAEGERARDRIGKELYDLNVQQFCCGGLNFGYFYDRSPIIAYDGESAPGYTMYDFTQSSVPGCHTPHVWLSEKVPLFDALGPEYTLLRTDPSVDVDEFMAAAAAHRIPIKLLDVAVPGAGDLYGRKLVLSRPDQHVAWRGDQPPSDAVAVLELISGRTRRSEAKVADRDISAGKETRWAQ